MNNIMEYTGKPYVNRTSQLLALMILLSHVTNIMAAVLSVDAKEKSTTQPPGIEATTSSLYDLQCYEGKCGTISYTHIKNTFKGLLYTKDEIRDMENAFNENRNDYLTSAGLTQTTNVAEPETLSDDGGFCCSTNVQHIANTTLKNIYGENKIVIHLADANPPSYQYIPHAKCVKKGSCNGSCFIEPKIMFLLVIDLQQGYKFDVFEIPGYCSCKNLYK